MKMNAQTLIAALNAISKLTSSTITGIEFEDGGGYRYIYKTVDNPKWTYIDLYDNPDMQYHFNPEFAQ